MDYYVAECLPCRWQEEHAEQEDAINAAEEHVLEHHPRSSASERTAKLIGHVQLRTPGQLATELPAPTASPEPEIPTPASALPAPPAPEGA